MALLNKEDILKAKDLTFEDVEVKEWGGTVRISSMSGKERDSFALKFMDDKFKPIDCDPLKMKMALLCHTIVDEEGKVLFSEEDLEELYKKSCEILDRLYEVSSRLNGMEEKNIDELAKN